MNHALLNLRKRGELRGLNSRRSSIPNLDDYRFAAEMAARFIERRDGISLDEIICDPELAAEFDELAKRLSPGYTSVEYRWPALNLRKAKNLRPEIVGRIVRPTSVESLHIPVLEVQKIPRAPGIYIFFAPTGVLYIGEAENLQNRLRKHLDHSDNKGLAQWLWAEGPDELYLEIHVLPAGTTTPVRRAYELELIRSRDAAFNIKR